MVRAMRFLLTVTALFSAAFFVLDAIQPRMSAHLYVPLRHKTYLTVDNRSGAWTFRIGGVGGVDGFEMGLTDTNQIVRQLRSKHFPFPINWYSDWYFDIGSSDPYYLLGSPLYFPALAFAIWPTARMIRRRRGWAKLAASDTEAFPDSSRPSDNAPFHRSRGSRGF